MYSFFVLIKDASGETAGCLSRPASRSWGRNNREHVILINHLGQNTITLLEFSHHLGRGI